jgi:cephalosporin hydroxylase
MTTWHESRTRSLAYRAVIKTRVEAEKRFGPTPAVRRGLGRLNRHNLSWLAAVYGSDKGAISHGYVDLYEQYLAGMRRRARRVLEIGIYRGASLQMWRDYFPRAEVYGVDIKEIAVPGSRIHTLVGDQSDPALLERLRALGPWDLIIDDGSHRQSHVLATFEGLYDSVAPGGYYVIEDMHTSYWPRGYEGGPPGMDGTSVSLIRGLLDGVNRRYAAKEYPDEAAALTPVDAVHVFEKIAFLKRPEAG